MKIMRIIVSAISLSALCMFAAGCASAGNNFDESKISQIKKGETTEADLVGIFGDPIQRGLDSNGMTTLTWMYVESRAKGESFIPYAGPFIGGTRSKNKTLNVTLNDGKVANFNFSGGGTETRSNQLQDVPKN